MDVALYHPVYGFYTRTDRARGPGTGRDFVTSPELSPIFGAAMARQADRIWQEMDSPFRFDLVDCGAGSGALSESLLEAADRSGYAWADSVTCHLVDPSPHLDISDDERVRIVSSLDMVTPPIEGMIFANELLDNLPGRVFRCVGGSWRELLVGLGPNGLEFVESGITEDSSESTPDGAIRVESPRVLELLRGLTRLLGAGAIVLVDYPRPPFGEELGGIRGFRAHSTTTDVLADPGEQDITLPVNWSEIVSALESAGMSVDPPISQAEWLDEIGTSDLVPPILEGKFAPLEERSRRVELDALTDPTGLGAHVVLVARKSRRQSASRKVT